MRQIIAARDPVRTEVWDRDRAIRHYEATNEPFKVELIEAIPGVEPIRMYWHGHWQDLCRGPAPRQYRPGPGRCLQADVDRRRLLARRLAPPDAPAHLRRRLPHAGRPRGPPAPGSRRRRSATTGGSAREMDLFHLQEEAPGSVFWHPNGFTLWRVLEDYIRRRQRRRRLRGGEDAAAARPRALGAVRPLGQVPREHVRRARPRSTTRTPTGALRQGAISWR